jgi:hypothetical protein
MESSSRVLVWVVFAPVFQKNLDYSEIIDIVRVGDREKCIRLIAKSAEPLAG